MRMKSANGSYRHPRKWMTRIYELLAAGRYASYWLPEFLICYQEILATQGEEAALEWALKELSLSLRPAVSVRAYRAIRLVYWGWRFYYKFSRR